MIFTLGGALTVRLFRNHAVKSVMLKLLRGTMTVKNKTKKWYYSTDGILEYNGFLCASPITVDRYEWAHGPFDSFSQAKKDALDRIKCDLDHLRITAREIRNTKKSDFD